MLLRKHFLPLLRGASPLSSRIYHRAGHLSTSSSPAPFSLEEYLVNSCGVAPAQARKAAKKAFGEASRVSRKPFEEVSHSRLNSASNPDAVLALLSGVGLSRSDIAAVVAEDPLLLRSSLKNIATRLHSLRDTVGLSTPQITQLLLVCPTALRCCSDVGPSVEFLISIFGSFEQLLVFVKKNKNIILSSLDGVIKPNIAQLREWGLSLRDITQLCSKSAWMLNFNPERVKESMLSVEELGVPRSSRMFKHVLAAITSTPKERFAAKVEFLKRTLGCSESEASIALTRMPNILGYSEETLLRKIGFLINDVGMEPKDILQRPVLFGLSLEKRLIPRHSVMKALQAKGLLKCNVSFYSLTLFREETFKLKFVDCHTDIVPGLVDLYAAASAGVVPS